MWDGPIDMLPNPAKIAKTGSSFAGPLLKSRVFDIYRKWEKTLIFFSIARNGTCYTSSECATNRGTPSGNCAAG